MSEKLFQELKKKKIHLSASHLPGKMNSWSDALSRHSTSAVEWNLKEETFLKLTKKFGTPEIDLFASSTNRKLPQYLSRTERTTSGGPDAMMEDWNKWQYIYLFPPPATTLMLQIVSRLQEFKGRVLLIAPLWRAQAWTQMLLQMCPEPQPLTGLILKDNTDPEFTRSLALHAWSF